MSFNRRRRSIPNADLSRRRALRYCIEALERRTLLSTWINPAGGSFTDPANWDTHLVPGPADDVFINLATACTVTLTGTAQVHSLTLGGAGGTQTLSIAAGELDLAAASSITSAGALLLNGSTLNQSAGLSNTGALGATTSTLAGAAALTNSAGGTLTLQDATVSSPLSNQGIVLSRGDSDAITGALTTAAGSVLRVQGNATYGAAALTVSNGFTSNGLVDLNSTDGAFDSTLAVSSGKLTTAVSTFTLVSAGTGGTRHLNARLQLLGALSVQAPLAIDKPSVASTVFGSVSLGGGDLTVNQSGTSPSFTLAGNVNIGFGRTLTVTGAPLTIAGGTVTGSGTLAATVNNTGGAISPALNGSGLTAYYEPFNYAAGSQLNGQGGWVEPGLNDPFSNDYNTPEIVQNAPGSSIGSLASSTLLTSGRSLRTNGLYSFDSINFGPGGFIGGNSGTFWFSVLIRQETAGGGGSLGPDFGGLALGNGDSTVLIGKPGGGPGVNNWALETPNSATQSASSVPAVIGTASFLVASVQFQPGLDHVTLYVNPAPGASQASLVPSATLDAELFAFNQLAISTGANALWTFDEIRMGTTYGDVAPRATGTLTINGDYTASSGAIFAADVFGNTPDSLYDQLNVNGAVSLGGALSINGQFVPAGAQTFTLLNNDGVDPVVGTFASLPEGTVTFVAGRAYRISYVGGDGNDVTATYLPGLSVKDISVTEGTGGTTTANFTVSLSDAGAATTTIQWATQDNSAVSPADYTAAGGTLTFGPDVTTQTVSIAVNPDSLDEANETFNLIISNPTNAVISDATGVCTILDDDPPPAIAVDDVSISEGDSGASLASFTLSLSAASGRTVTVQASTADGTATAPSDYAAIIGQVVTFNPGDTSKTVSVTINGDTQSEFDETFVLNLSNQTNATISDAQGTGTIVNDDPVPVTGAFSPITPDPRTDSLGSIDVTFSQAVSGFDLSDLSLTRDGSAIDLSGVTLSSVDNINWTLGGLDTLTARAGSYGLNLPSDSSAVQSIATGAPFLLGANATWKMTAVLGTNSSDTITLGRESGGGIYDVYVNNATLTPDYSVNLATLGTPLQVLGLDGRDTLRVIGQPGDQYTVSAGTITHAAETITYASPVEILNLDTGTFTVTGDLSDPGGFDLLATGSATTVVLDATQHLDMLNVGTGSTVRADEGGGKVIVAGNLIVDGSLDLTDNNLIVPAGALGTWTGLAYDGITGLIGSGAIVSSSAQEHFTALGVAAAGSVFGISGSQTALFEGQVVSPSDVLVKYTYDGDANLDGKVNIDDYGRIDGNVGLSGAVFGWYNGDFNYDGKINIDDYGIIDSVIGIQGPPL